MSNEALKPKFKLFDVRLKNFYRGKFAFSSDNNEFQIKNVMINGEKQVCTMKNKQVWPFVEDNVEIIEVTTIRNRVTTTFRSSNKEITSPDNSCGQIKKMETFGNFLSLPSMPGQFPWSVSIYRYFDDEEESYYKCAGTIIDRSTVLTSVNCLLEDGLLLKGDDLQVHVSPFSLSAKKQKFKIYNIAEVITHEDFNFQLENNIAAVKLAKNINFNDYVQPICLPQRGYLSLGKLGKVWEI